ncbi:MAG: hypothetical protein WC495_04200 [Patescibacteria group bacterium]|jgi:hypothetical protein
MKIDTHVLEKGIVWSAICVIFSVAFFYVLEQSFTISLIGEGSVVTLMSRIFLPIVLFSAFLGAIGIHGMIIPGRLFRYITIFTASVAMFIFFKATAWSGIALVLFFGGVVAYHMSIQGDAKSRVTVVPYYTLTSGLGTVILILIASVSLLFYSTYADKTYEIDGTRAALRDSLVATTISTLEKQVTGFSGDQTVDQLIANMLTGRMSTNLLPEFTDFNLNNDPERTAQIDQLKATINEQQQALQTSENQFAVVATDQLGSVEKQLIDQVRSEVSQSIGIELQGDETIRDALVKITDRRIMTFITPYLHYAPIVFSASLFLLLYIFSFLYRYLTRAFGLLWYGILRLVHFIKIREEDVKAKRISLEH